jgi:hypothetical protein
VGSSFAVAARAKYLDAVAMLQELLSVPVYDLQ